MQNYEFVQTNKYLVKRCVAFQVQVSNLLLNFSHKKNRAFLFWKYFLTWKSWIEIDVALIEEKLAWMKSFYVVQSRKKKYILT